MERSGVKLFDVAVVGGGAAGFAAALAAAKAGRATVLFAPPATFPPGRTAALLGGSIDFLADLGVWPALEEHAEPITAIRLVDATSRLIRAPEATFHASEVGLPAFGYNVPNGDLVDALRRHAESIESLTLVAAPVESVAPGEDEVQLAAAGESFAARLVVAADGARSLAREAAGIRVKTWSYRQSALVATLKSSSRIRVSRRSFTPRTAPSRWCRFKATVSASSGSTARSGRNRLSVFPKTISLKRPRGGRTRSTAPCGWTASLPSFP